MSYISTQHEPLRQARNSDTTSAPDIDQCMEYIAKEMPNSLILDRLRSPRSAAGTTAEIDTPQAYTPPVTSRITSREPQGVTIQHQEDLMVDAMQQNAVLLVALGDYLEQVGRTLAGYGNAERELRSGAQVLPPGTLMALQCALASLAPDAQTDEAGRSPVSIYNGGQAAVDLQTYENVQALANTTQFNVTPEFMPSDVGDHQEKIQKNTSLRSLMAGRETDRGSMVSKKASASPEMEKKASMTQRITNNLGELVVALVISFNAIVLGVSADIDWRGWQGIEYFFTCFFLLEMLCKWYSWGVPKYFCGAEWMWNWFDFTLVGIAITDTTLSVVYPEDSEGNDVLGQFTIVKIVRLGRLARFVRVLRFQMFKELQSIINGVFSGLRVLFWAVVLLFILIYTVAVALRQLIRDDNSVDKRLRKGFESMPASMNTLFMCFTDGCTAFDGTPIPVHLYDQFGVPFMVCYMLTMLFVTIGVFNLIMAIFVDNVLERGRQKKQQQRAGDRFKLEARLRQTVRKFAKGYAKAQQLLREKTKESLNDGLERGWSMKDSVKSVISSCMDKLGAATFPSENKRKSVHNEDGDVVINRKMFIDLLKSQEMQQTLALLDIETSTRDELFDVLDADMSGELDFDELILGLMTLRGPAEKKDAIGALLSIRATQVVLREIQEQAQEQMSALTEEVKQMQQLLVHRSTSKKGTMSLSGPLSGFRPTSSEPVAGRVTSGPISTQSTDNLVASC